MACVEAKREIRQEADDASRPKLPLRIVWLTTGTLSLSLGVAGLVLPLLPTTPFVILAAWCFARSSPELRERLVSSRMLGPPLRDWQRERAIARPAKIRASALMAILIAVSVAGGVPNWIVVLQALVAAGVLLFLWSRPNACREG